MRPWFDRMRMAAVFGPVRTWNWTVRATLARSPDLRCARSFAFSVSFFVRRSRNADRSARADAPPRADSLAWNFLLCGNTCCSTAVTSLAPWVLVVASWVTAALISSVSGLAWPRISVVISRRMAPLPMRLMSAANRSKDPSPTTLIPALAMVLRGGIRGLVLDLDAVRGVVDGLVRQRLLDDALAADVRGVAVEPDVHGDLDLEVVGRGDDRSLVEQDRGGLGAVDEPVVGGEVHELRFELAHHGAQVGLEGVLPQGGPLEIAVRGQPVGAFHGGRFHVH